LGPADFIFIGISTAEKNPIRLMIGTQVRNSLIRNRMGIRGSMMAGGGTGRGERELARRQQQDERAARSRENDER
jgi:hypothetical protein